MRSSLRLVTWSSLPIAGLAVGFVLATSGTAANSHASAAAHRSVPVNALVVGTLTDCGGPPDPVTHRTRCFSQDHAVVSAISSRHRLVARETVTNGSFAFSVRPGKFMLVAGEPQCCHAERSVTAEAGKTVHANIVFHIK
jgi:hypothetical protein